MKAEIICIGTELLLVDVVNTNASFFGKELSLLGIDLHYVTTVGDNPQRIIDSLETAFSRADLIITSGGLGPTKDDLTHACIADFLGVPMEFFPEIATWLKNLFSTLNKEITESNLKQAWFPKGSVILANDTGTAPGIIYQKEQKSILTFPGVPSELKDMWTKIAVPYIKKINPDQSVIKSKILRFIGEGESFLADQVSDLLDLNNPTVAPLAGKGEVVLRVTAKAETEEKAHDLITPVETEIIKRVGKFYYGADQDSLTSVISDLLHSNSETLAIADFLTDGILVSRISFSSAVKFSLTGKTNDFPLFISEIFNNIPANFAVNQESAIFLADKMREKFSTDWGISLLGSRAENPEEKSLLIFAVSSTRGIKVKEMTVPYFKKDDLNHLASQFVLNLLRLKMLKR